VQDARPPVGFLLRPQRVHRTDKLAVLRVTLSAAKIEGVLCLGHARHRTLVPPFFSAIAARMML
jgi:hypothetical protein